MTLSSFKVRKVLGLAPTCFWIVLGFANRLGLTDFSYLVF